MAAQAPSPTSQPASRWDRLLARLGLQGLGNLPQAVRPPATLGIDGIPEQLAPLPSRLNTAVTGPDGEHFWLWRQQLLRSLKESAPVFVLAASAQEMDHLLAPEDLREAHTAERIQTWIWPSDAQNIVAARQFPDWLAELHTAGLRPQHALFCTNASALLEQLNLLQLDRTSSQWLHWARQRRQPSVWCFPLQPGRSQVRHVVSAMARCFLYAAHLENTLRGEALLLERWDGAHGAVFNSRYGLQLAHGLIRADGSVVRGAQARMAQAPDANVVYATAACLLKLRTLPPHWESVADWQTMEASSAHAVGATILLDAGTLEQFDTLAALVHRLRISHPPTLKIVVLEATVKLRTHHELALLALGANEVLYKELRFARVIRRIEDLRDHVYASDVPADYEVALQDFMPVATHGYQAPHAFITMARSMVAQAERHAMDHAMVQLHLLPHVSHTMALREFCGTRYGDLMTADQHSVWLFLFACREIDVDDTLPRLFNMPLNNLFSSQTSYAQLPGIADQLSILTAQDLAHPLPDYGQLMQQQERRRTTRTETARAEPPAPAMPVHESPVFSAPSAAALVQWSSHPLGHSATASKPPLP